MSGRIPTRVAVTGSGGRLGSALMEALEHRGIESVGWRRTEFDLDAPDPDVPLARDRPQLVIHCAAWTDVDACARDPALAMRRNGDAAGRLGRACAAAGAGLVLVSTNEVFDGERSDGRGYAEVDLPGPRNAYGRSKRAGEEAAQAAFGSAPGLWIVRTAWLYGPPGVDFPARILAAADRLAPGEPLPVVADEHGSPTLASDLGTALIDLIGATEGGLFHLAHRGAASRYEWAERVLHRCRPERPLRPISRREFVRASDPPPWGVLDVTHADAVAGVRLRAWEDALEDYLARIC